MNAITPLVWADSLSVGEPSMDATHREFVALLAAARQADDISFGQLLQDFLVHTEEHFEDEERQMRQTAFPSSECHLSEHAAVLASIREVLDLVNTKGRVDIGRDLCNELARWFPEHTRAMDLGVAKWIMKQRVGGAAMVFVRDAAYSDSSLESN